MTKEEGRKKWYVQQVQTIVKEFGAHFAEQQPSLLQAHPIAVQVDVNGLRAENQQLMKIYKPIAEVAAQKEQKATKQRANSGAPKA